MARQISICAWSFGRPPAVTRLIASGKAAPTLKHMNVAHLLDRADWGICGLLGQAREADLQAEEIATRSLVRATRMRGVSGIDRCKNTLQIPAYQGIWMLRQVRS